MMPGNDEGASAEGAEGTDLVRVRKPSKEALGLFSLASLMAGQSSGMIPQGHAAGTALFTAALVFLGRHCLYRK
ncbi:hypothetical protein [Streptomyces mirabilis]|uniref:hypothetical protein n=1 Tax=Streptomyces mirabilis TaxID=68239 RepID=UPI0036AC7F3B